MASTDIFSLELPGTPGTDAFAVDASGNVTCAGTFTSTGTDDFGSGGIKADVIAESTSAAGVTVDGMVIKDSGIANSAALTIESSGGAISIGANAVAQAVNIATGNAARAITIGHSASASLTMHAGAGALTADATGAVDIDGGGAVSLESSGAAINVGADAVAQPVNIGTGAAARVITVGNAASASLTLEAGVGALTANADTTITVTSGTGTTVAGGLRVSSGTASAITTTRVLTAADSGGVFSVDKQTAYAITLPTPAQGMDFTFMVLDTGANIVTISDGSAHLYGVVSIANVSTAMTGTTVGLASGGSVGDWVRFQGIDSTHYLVTGACIAAADITIT